MAPSKFCRHCGTALTPAARFCAQCGLSLDATATAAPAAPERGASAILPWFVLAAAMLGVIGFLVGTRMSPGVAAGAAGAAGAPVAADGGAIVAAPDISSLSPEERVDRLFNRVMTLASAGQQDSVAFFAPMAVNAIAALMPLDAHRRYDLGLIHLAAGDAPAARAQADTILAAEPAHLLGLALAMRVATAQGRTADARRFGATLTSAAPRERARGRLEYADHAPDITEALEEAAGKRTSRILPQR